jgi:hypothetical protein
MMKIMKMIKKKIEMWLLEQVCVLSGLYFRSHMPTVNILVNCKAALDTQGGGTIA